MTVFGDASGSIWENWIREHGEWIGESKDPVEFFAKFLWTPFGAASTACAAYVDEYERHPAGTLAKTAGAAATVLIPGAGVIGACADAAALAAGNTIGKQLNQAQDEQDSAQHHAHSRQQALRQQHNSRNELKSLFG